MIERILVTLLGIIFSVGIYQFFLGKKDNQQEEASENSVDILVDGGYKPQNILVQKGAIVRLNFYRKDPSSCLEEVVLPDFGKKAYLPLNQTTVIEIKADKAGEYEISCGMNMFHGKITVKE